MSTKGKVVSVNISKEKGEIKHPVDSVQIDERGIVGDAHAGPWHRQVSVLSKEDIDIFEKQMDRKIAPGEFAENITTSGIDLNNAAALDRFEFGGVELLVTQRGKKCHGDGCAIYREIGKCVMPEKGLFAKVIKTGLIKAGDTVEYFPKTMNFVVITLSDRAFAGEYSDRSGQQAKEILEAFKFNSKWPVEVTNILLPDDPEKLKEQLQKAIDVNADAIFTLGGTGIGPKDITPETVLSVCDKTIPGIMENIRIKFGAQKSSALLSRSVAAIADKTLVYTLPGSVRAVQEYLQEILKTIEHAIFMIHDVDIHGHSHVKAKTQESK